MPSSVADGFVQLPEPDTGGGVVVTRTVLGGETVATLGPLPHAVRTTKTAASAPIQTLGDLTNRGILSISGRPPHRLTDRPSALSPKHPMPVPATGVNGVHSRAHGGGRPRSGGEGIRARHRSHPRPDVDGSRTADLPRTALAVGR